MKFGAIHTPRPSGIARLASRVGAASTPIPNWLERFPADGDALGNDWVGNCVPAADCQIIRLWGGRMGRESALGRYQTMTGFDPATGLPNDGSDTAKDMLAWCAAPMLDLDGKPWPIYWASVGHTDIGGIRSALALFPLLLTVGLPAEIADEPEMWANAQGDGWTPDVAHRVVLGFEDDKGWWVRSWGLDFAVSPSLMSLMLLAVDVPIPHPSEAPSELQIDGLDYQALAADLAGLGEQT